MAQRTPLIAGRLISIRMLLGGELVTSTVLPCFMLPVVK